MPCISPLMLFEAQSTPTSLKMARLAIPEVLTVELRRGAQIVDGLWVLCHKDIVPRRAYAGVGAYAWSDQTIADAEREWRLDPDGRRRGCGSAARVAAYSGSPAGASWAQQHWSVDAHDEAHMSPAQHASAR